MKITAWFIAVAPGLLQAVIAAPAAAQEKYPARLMRLVVPSVPAGAFDRRG
jgi:hypothetical protein